MTETDPASQTRFRLPITAVAVFGVGSLIALAVGIVLYLGLISAARNTGQLWIQQSEVLIDSMEDSIDVQLRPVKEQSRWIGQELENVFDPADLSALDSFMFGALAATPQVAGIVIVTPDAQIWCWDRSQPEAVSEDWSGRPGIVAWVRGGEEQAGAAWREPVWAMAVGTTVVLHETPLRRDGAYVGMLGQIVPVSNLSHQLGTAYTQTGMTPFILYDRQQVLAHPLLIGMKWERVLPGVSLLPLGELGDVALERIWSPDESEPYFFRGVTELEAVGAFLGDKYYLYLYRDITHYGPAPWTVGMYLNTELLSSDETRRMFTALIGGLSVLLLSVVAAAYVGQRVTRPIKALAAATRFVEAKRFADVPAFPPSLIRELDDATRSFNQMVQGLREQELIRETLGRFVPEDVAKTLLSEGGSIEAEQVEATVLFCDVESFTQLTEALGPTGIVAVLNAFFSAMVEILERHDGVVTQFQGDAILATFNVPITNTYHAANACAAAFAMLSKADTETFAGQRLGIRIGVNTGTLVAGAVGAEGRLSYTVHGDAVNLAARLESLNKEYSTRLLVSENTVQRVSDFGLAPVGEAAVRGQSGKIRLYAPERTGNPRVLAHET
ncbi:MAG: adenylate/guanylate cyclase domain-containing protein [Gammaproteobacteria bacterium]